MKPDWDKAPEWANWLAKDADGRWFWHQRKPRERYRDWDSDGWVATAGTTLEDWKGTLTQRPQRTKPAEAGSEGQGA